jgi:hypothetical protein
MARKALFAKTPGAVTMTDLHSTKLRNQRFSALYYLKWTMLPTAWSSFDHG